MKKYLTLLLVMVICKLSTAQDVKPVQFNFTAKPINDSTVQLIVAAKISKGSQLFSTKKANADDAFVSTLTLDTSAKTLATIIDSVTEKGALQLVKSSDSSNYKLYSDSVSFTYTIHVKTDGALTLKGSFTALLKKGEEFPSEEEKFSVAVEPASIKNDVAKKDDTLLSVFLLCFATGLFAIITPCVFPLTPRL